MPKRDEQLTKDGLTPFHFAHHTPFASEPSGCVLVVD
jgi:hypothetical protein